MDLVDKRAIQSNFISLVETTDLDAMVNALYEKRVFSEQMIEPYRDSTVPQRERKRNLYLDITRRGPQAFGRLLDVLKELGYWDLVRDLDPNSSLHLRPRPTSLAAKATPQPQNSFISLSNEKVRDKEKKKTSKSEAPKTAAPAPVPAAPVPAPAPATDTANGPAPRSNNNEEDIPEFKVIKSTRFIEDNESKDIKPYRMRGKKRVMLIFSYITFKYNIEPIRKGVDVDIKNLKYLFHELGYDVLCYTDLGRKETLETLAMLKEVLVGCESVFVMMSSHGYERRGTSDSDLRCSDGELLSLMKVISYFSNQSLPHLAHVPKVFVFQMCRGSSTDYIYGQDIQRPEHLRMPETDGTTLIDEGDARGGQEGAHKEGLKRMGIYSNILIAQSTLPGFVSYRDPKEGSLYIKELCSVFAARAHDTHVDELFTLVDRQLEKSSPQTSSVDRWRFNHHLYLHPGLHE